MRVFYDNNDENESTSLNINRNYYVKIDNVAVPDELKGFKLISACTIEELILKVGKYYGLDKNPDVLIELWSNSNFTGKRLDILKEIPLENEFIWLRVKLDKKY